ncbi:hypothetical protein MMC26_003712 [Xylographa opegraphella]|nr:hypothetical protein [Xylographa opegraphella]
MSSSVPQIQTGAGATSAGTLDFNPEYDFLHISPEIPVKDTLVDFLYHLKVICDPRHVGLLNLAVELNDLNANDLDMLKSSDLESRIRTVFVETLAQLHEVFLICTERAGRQILGFQSEILTAETIFNRSLPIMAMTPGFERLHHDPRPITHDLQQVTFHHLIIEYRFYLAFTTISRANQIYDLFPFFEKQNMKWTVGAASEKYKNGDLDKAVKRAFGFWLFPVDALDPFPEKALSEDEGFPFKPKQFAKHDAILAWARAVRFALARCHKAGYEESFAL